MSLPGAPWPSASPLAPRQSPQPWAMGTATLQCPSIALAAPCHHPSCHPLSQFRLVVKMALKLLLVFVEYTEPNALLLIRAVNAVDRARGGCRPSHHEVPAGGTVSPHGPRVTFVCRFSQACARGPT